MDLSGRKIRQITLQKPIGSGGMGDVYLGFDESLGRKVAVKVIRFVANADQKTKQRLKREAQLLSKLEHPNICRVYNYIEEPDHDFIVLEYIDGETLDKVVKDLSAKAKLNVAIQISEALQVAHHLNIVHRDLKPKNVMMTNAGLIKILDFGIARMNPQSEPQETISMQIDDLSGIDRLEWNQDGMRTNLGRIEGTPLFMSPEQARGEFTTVSSDIYSLGLLLQYLFTGQNPYDAHFKELALIVEVMHARTKTLKGLDPHLTALINRMKESKPETRPVISDILERLKWIQEKPKRKLKSRVILAFFTVLSIGILVSVMGFFKASHEAKSARETADLLTEFLTSPEPYEKGKDVKVLELLEAFSPRLESLGENPVVQARLLEAYAQTYQGLGFFDRAIGYAERSFELRKKHFGLEHPQTLDIMNTLGNIFEEAGEFSKAERLLRQCLNLRLKTQGDLTFDVLNSMNSLANVLKAQTRFEEAQKLYESCLNNCKKSKEDVRELTILCMHNLAAIHHSLGKLEQAETSYRELYQLKLDHFGAEHPSTQKTYISLGVVLGNLGRFEEAEEVMKVTIPIQKRTLGDHHPLTFLSLVNRAVNLRDLGRMDRSTELYEETIPQMKIHLGEEHLYTLVAQSNLAENLVLQSQFKESEKLAKETYLLKKQKFGTSHGTTLNTQITLIHACLGQKKLVEARAETHQLLTSSAGSELGHELLIKFHDLGRQLKQLGWEEEAEQCLSRTIGKKDAH